MAGNGSNIWNEDMNSRLNILGKIDLFFKDKSKKEFNIWIGTRASDYFMFRAFVDIDLVVSLDFECTLKVPSISPALTLDPFIKFPTGNEDLFGLKNLKIFREVFLKLKTSPKKVNVFCYHSFPYIEKITKQNRNIKIHSCSIALKRKLDKKQYLFNQLTSLGLNRIPWEKIKLRESKFAELKKTYGSPFILKSIIGTTGRSTYLVNNKRKFDKLVQSLEEKEVIVSKFMDGWILNVNVCINKNIQLSQPSIQLIKSLNDGLHEFIYYGNDFSAYLKIDKEIQNKVLKMSREIAKIVREPGYFGFLGIDFIFCQRTHSLYPLEINPRMQGSTPLLERYLKSKNKGLLTGSLFRQNSFDPDFKVKGSILLIHNTLQRDLVIKKSISSGRYKCSITKGKLVLNQLDEDMDFPKGQNEVLILSCPKKGSVVKPGAIIVRVEFPNSVYDLNQMNVNPDTSTLIDKIFEYCWV